MENGRQRKTLLVVDDEPIITQVLENILGGEYRLKVVRDGSSALRAARQGEVDLILLDVMMPVVNGFEVCCALKNDPLTARIPVIFLTGQDGAEGECLGFEVGGADYIVKPFSPREVRARIRAQLLLAGGHTASPRPCAGVAAGA